MPEAQVLPPASQTSQQRTHVPICAPQQRHCSLTESISLSPGNRYLLTAPTLMPVDPHSAGVLPSLPDALTCAAIQAAAQAAQAPGVAGSKMKRQEMATFDSHSWKPVLLNPPLSLCQCHRLDPGRDGYLCQWACGPHW